MMDRKDEAEIERMFKECAELAKRRGVR